MHLIHNNTRQNVVNHVADTSHANRCGLSADRIVAASKRLLARKRPSTLGMYEPVAVCPGMRMPEFTGHRQPASGGRRPARRTAPANGVRPRPAGEMPAAIWAALVISRALSS